MSQSALTDADDARACTSTSRDDCQNIATQCNCKAPPAMGNLYVLYIIIATFKTTYNMALSYVGRRDNLGDIFLPVPIMGGGKGREGGRARGICYAHANMQTDTPTATDITLPLTYTALLLQSPHQRHRYRPLHPADRGRRHRGVPHSGRRSQSHRHHRTAPEKISQGTNDSNQ